MCIRLALSGRHRAQAGSMPVNKHHTGPEHRRPGLWEARLGSRGYSLDLAGSSWAPHTSTEQALVSGAQADPVLISKSGQHTGLEAQRTGLLSPSSHWLR